MNNPPVQEYVSKHAELGDEFSIEIYGNVSEEVIDNINELGLPLQHFKTTRVGYVRDDYFKKQCFKFIFIAKKGIER